MRKTIGAVLAFVLLAPLSIRSQPETTDSSPRQGQPTDPALAKRIEQRVRDLGAPRFRTREAAMKELLVIGRPAVPALQAALKCSDPDVQLRARLLLQQIGSGVPYLVEELKSKDAGTRRKAAARLGQLGAAARLAVPALVKALADPDESVRDEAAGALETLDPTNKALANRIPRKASVNGKYGKLLRKIKVEQDRQNYGEYRDYGPYQATDYGGHMGIPAGYWVYVYPHWYIWGELKQRRE